MAKKLTTKQTRFVEEYVVDFNAAGAARRAGYSQKTATEIGAENLRKPHIARALQAKQTRLTARTEITAEKVLREYARLGFADIRDVLELRGGQVFVKDSTEWTEDQAAAISEIAQLKDGSIRVKQHSKTHALDALGRYLGLDAPKEVDIIGKLQTVIDVVFEEESPAPQLPSPNEAE